MDFQTFPDWDQQLFLWLNGWHSPWADVAMYWITDRLTWIPLYLLIIWFLFRLFGIRAFWAVAAIVLTITLADRISSGFFKPYFSRNRPCHEAAIAPQVHLVRGCGGQHGFVSSHAANTFALALFLWLLLGRRFRAVGWFFVWAFVVSYSRIYTGVHYPLDLLGGAAVGMTCAGLVFLGYRALMQLPGGRITTG